jgi:phosphate transport system ATP-binding protein
MVSGNSSAAKRALAPELRPGAPVSPSVHDDVVLDCHIADLFYGNFRAVRDTAVPIRRNSITAFIGL